MGRPVRAMVVGIPNVGKSTFINKVARKKSAKAGDRPGVTRGKQWITVDQGLELLDTPGILWPKFEDETIGLHLAFTGAVRDAIMDVETLACHLIQLLAQRKPESLAARFKLVPEEGMDGWALLEAGARKRGFLISGGEVDLELSLIHILYRRHGQIAAEVNRRLEEEEETVDIAKLIAEMTNEQAYQLLQKAELHAKTVAEPAWSQQEGHWAKATAEGVVDGTSPERPMKRDEVIAVLGRKGLL